jgi:hypothetical protein
MTDEQIEEFILDCIDLNLDEANKQKAHEWLQARQAAFLALNVLETSGLLATAAISGISNGSLRVLPQSNRKPLVEIDIRDAVTVQDPQPSPPAKNAGELAQLAASFILTARKN